MHTPTRMRDHSNLIEFPQTNTSGGGGIFYFYFLLFFMLFFIQRNIKLYFKNNIKTYFQCYLTFGNSNMSSRFTFSNFGKLPILAKTLWNVPKYLPDVPHQQTFNKLVGIYRPDFKIVCSFTHKTNYTYSMFHIKSDLTFWCEKYRMEERCIFSNMNAIHYFEIMYTFQEKCNEEQVFFSKKIDDFSIKLLTNDIQDIKTQINELLNNNKNECVVS